VEADNNESPKDDKENDIKSPRNRFAVLSPSKKPKFNLNAPKEVVKSNTKRDATTTIIVV
jgi:hypothetical protein